VDERLHFNTRGSVNLANLVDRQLAGQHDALDAESFHRTNALGAGERHLRRSVDRQIGADRANEPHQP
jgi:hypothetical protein